MYEGKFNELPKFKKFASNKIRLLLNFEYPRNFFCLLLFYNVHIEKMFTIERKDGRKAPESLEYIYFACLGVCLFVSNKRHSKRLNRSGPIFCGTPGKVYE